MFLFDVNFKVLVKSCPVSHEFDCIVFHNSNISFYLFSSLKKISLVCLFVYFCFVLCFYILPHFVNFFIARFIAGLIIDFPIIPSSVAQFVAALLTKVRGYESSCQKLGGKFIYSKYVHLEYLCTFLSSVASCVRRISRSFCTIKWF